MQQFAGCRIHRVRESRSSSVVVSGSCGEWELQWVIVAVGRSHYPKKILKTYFSPIIQKSKSFCFQFLSVYRSLNTIGAEVVRFSADHEMEGETEFTG